MTRHIDLIFLEHLGCQEIDIVSVLLVAAYTVGLRQKGCDQYDEGQADRHSKNVDSRIALVP